jgi:hypothetical protein
MSQHNISRSTTILQGRAYNAVHAASYNGSPGLPVSLPIFYNYGAIVAADRDGLVESVNPADAATLTLRSTVTGMTNSGGVVTLGTPRNVTIYATTDESAKTITVTGTDLYNQAMTETITGPDGSGAVKITHGNKAFKTISSIVATGNFGTIEVGFGSKVGLPYRVTDKNQVNAYSDGRLLAPETLTATITALGTAQDVAVISPIGGVVTKVSGVSAAQQTSGISTVTLTNATLEVAVLSFAADYAALAAVTDSTLSNTRLAANDVIKAATDGTGDGAGQATVTILVDTAVVTIADDTTATATTGDVRGTVDFGYAPNGTLKFAVTMFPADRSEAATAFGVTPA